MSYNDVKTFLKECKKPEKYNFEYECDIEEYIKLEPFDRYFTYKATDPARLKSDYPAGKAFAVKLQKEGSPYNKLQDCDGTLKGSRKAGDETQACKLTREVYRKLWNWDDQNNEKIKRYGKSDSFFPCEFGPDTVNSVQNILNHILDKKIVPDNEKYQSIKGTNNCSINLSLELYETEKNNSKENNSKENKFISALENISKFKEFVDIYHTIGNFLLVPAGFNVERNQMFSDFWDLSLQYLQQATNNPWLIDYTFEKYVNYFFLWDYVICNDKKTVYYVKSLLSDEFDIKDENKKYCEKVLLCTYREMPNPEETEMFLHNCIWAIKRRGIFMTSMLRISCECGNEGKAFYKKLQDEIFSYGNCYNSYQEVFEKIKKVKGHENFKLIIEKAQEDINNVKIDEE